LLLLVLLQFGAIQSIIVKKTLDFVNKKYDVCIAVQELKLTSFGDFKLKNIQITDHHLDTLLFVKSVSGHVLDLQKIKNKKLTLENVVIENAWVNDKIYAEELKSNLAVFSEKFKKKKQNNSIFKLAVHHILIKNSRFSNYNGDRKIVDFYRIGGTMDTLFLEGTDLKIISDGIGVTDNYGIVYQKIKTDFNYSATQMSFKNTFIKTENSEIHTNLFFAYDSISQFKDFVNLVKLQGEIEEGKIGFADIHKIYPHYQQNKSLSVKTKAYGTLNDLKLRDVKMHSPKDSIRFSGDLELFNTISHRSCLGVRVDKGYLDLKPGYLINIIPDQYKNNIPYQFYGVENIVFNGTVDVTKTEVFVDGKLKTNLGALSLHSAIYNIDTPLKKIELDVLDGVLFKNKMLKDFKSAHFSGVVNGFVSNKGFQGESDFYLNSINYQNINLKKSVLSFKATDKTYITNMSSKDSLLTFDAKLAYKKAVDTDYHLIFNIEKAKLSKLFPNHISHQKNIKGKGVFNLHQSQGVIQAIGEINTLKINTQAESLIFDLVKINASLKPEFKQISVASNDLIDFNAQGNFQFNDFEKLLNNGLSKFLPIRQKRLEVENQSLDFELNLKPKLIESVTDKFKLKNDFILKGLLDANRDKCVIVAKTPKIKLKNAVLDSLSLVLDNSNTFLNSNLSIKKIKYKKQLYDNISLLGKKINDTLYVRSNFKTDKINNRAVIYLTSLNDEFTAGIENLYLKYLDQIWVKKPIKNNKVIYSIKNKSWSFDEICLVNKKQEFEFKGAIKQDDYKDLKLRLQNVNLSQIVPAVDSLKLKGLASGEVYFRAKEKSFKPQGNLKITNLNM